MTPTLWTERQAAFWRKRPVLLVAAVVLLAAAVPVAMALWTGWQHVIVYATF